jgi:hypothetical protein
MLDTEKCCLLLVTLAGVLSIPFAEIDEPFAAWVNMDKRL